MTKLKKNQVIGKEFRMGGCITAMNGGKFFHIRGRLLPNQLDFIWDLLGFTTKGT
jgi:hypothetical protein